MWCRAVRTKRSSCGRGDRCAHPYLGGSLELGYVVSSRAMGAAFVGQRGQHDQGGNATTGAMVRTLEGDSAGVIGDAVALRQSRTVWQSRWDSADLGLETGRSAGQLLASQDGEWLAVTRWGSSPLCPRGRKCWASCGAWRSSAGAGVRRPQPPRPHQGDFESTEKRPGREIRGRGLQTQPAEDPGYRSGSQDPGIQGRDASARRNVSSSPCASWIPVEVSATKWFGASTARPRASNVASIRRNY